MSAFFNKRIIAVSMAALTIFCTSCSNTVQDDTGGAIVSIGTAQPSGSEVTENEKTEVKIGLVKNSAAALGATPLFINTENDTAYEKYMPVVFNTIDELMQAFINDEVDMAVMPPDKALLSYQNTQCRVAAVTGGSNYYIAENGSAINDISDLNGKEITVSAEDDMADTVLNIIAEHNDITVTYKWVDTNQQLIDGLKNGNISLALTQEPYLSYVTSENVKSAIDLYDYWNEAVDSELVSSCLVVRNDFISGKYNAFQNVLKDYNAAAQIARRDAQATAEAANRFALTDNIDACKAAVPGCGVTFKTGTEMKKMMDDFYKAVKDSNPDILGGNMPDEGFYHINE